MFSFDTSWKQQILNKILDKILNWIFDGKILYFILNKLQPNLGGTRKMRESVTQMRYSKVSGYFEIFMCGLFFHLKKGLNQKFFFRELCNYKAIMNSCFCKSKGRFPQ